MSPDSTRDVIKVLVVNSAAIGVGLTLEDILTKVIPALVATSYTIWKWYGDYQKSKKSKNYENDKN